VNAEVGSQMICYCVCADRLTFPFSSFIL